MPNPKAIPLSDALTAVTQPNESASPMSLDEALASVAATQSPKAEQGSKAALAMQAAKIVLPAAGRVAEEFGTSPTAAATVSAVARNATTFGAVAHGVATMNPAQVIAAPREGWAAGKGALFLTKGAQAIARPVATTVEKLAPYTQALGTLSGAQGVGDWAQLAEPTRTDIGVLGIGKTQHVPGQQPALLNLLAQKLSDAVAYLIGQGMSQGEAVKTVMNLKVKAGK